MYVSRLFLFLFLFSFFFSQRVRLFIRLLVNGKAFAIDWVIKYFMRRFAYENYLLLFTSKYL